MTPNFSTSSSSLLSTLLTATFSYCSRSKATCKRSQHQDVGRWEDGDAGPSPHSRRRRQHRVNQPIGGARRLMVRRGTAIPTSLPTKELLFSKISARYRSVFLWKKLRTSSALQENHRIV